MSDYPTATITLEDTRPSRVRTADVKLEADPWGISLILPDGQELFLEYHAGHLVLHHYEDHDDSNPKVLFETGVE